MLFLSRSPVLHRCVTSCRAISKSLFELSQTQSVTTVATEQKQRRLRVGDFLEVERTFGPEDVEAFLRLCGDTNPIHSCPVAAGEAHGFDKAILPGLLCASLFPGIIGSNYPGAIYLSQTLKFRAAALVGEPLLARVTVKSMSGHRAVFETDCFQASNGAVVADGEAVTLLGPVYRDLYVT